MSGQSSRGDADWEVRHVRFDDPVVEPLLVGLMLEYTGRYPEWGGGAELDRLPTDDWDPPGGTFMVIVEHGTTIAGGAFRRVDDTTAELKRIWTSADHRRRGLARRVLAELERVAAERGYRRVTLTMGPRQPEARELYLTSGYTPLFDVNAHPVTDHSLEFVKDLAAPCC